MTFKIQTNLKRINLSIFCPEITHLTSVFVQCIFGSLVNINMIQIVALCKHVLRQCEVQSVVWWNLKCQLKMMTYLMPTGHTLKCLLKQNCNWLQWEVCWSENGRERKRHKQRHDLKYYSRHQKGQHFVPLVPSRSLSCLQTKIERTGISLLCLSGAPCICSSL